MSKKVDGAGVRSVPDVDESGDAAYILTRWKLTLSEKGCCWVRPVGEVFTPEELAGFVELFRRSCDAGFPHAVVFDFSGSRIIGEQWSLAFDLLEDFARTIHARCRVICSRRCSRKAVVIFHRVRRG